MRECVYEFNKPSKNVLNDIETEIQNNFLFGSVNNQNVELQFICDGYRYPSSYKLSAVVQDSDSGCILKGKYHYVMSKVIIALVLAVIMVAFSVFMAIAYTSDIGKYLLGFSAMIIAAYGIMTFLKRKEVIRQTENLFDRINTKMN